MGRHEEGSRNEEEEYESRNGRSMQWKSRNEKVEGRNEGRMVKEVGTVNLETVEARMGE